MLLLLVMEDYLGRVEGLFKSSLRNKKDRALLLFFILLEKLSAEDLKGTFTLPLIPTYAT